MATIPALEYTTVDVIPGIVNRVRSSFLSHKTRPLEWRLKQLRKLYWAIKDHEAEIVEACKLDLGKPGYESYLVESSWLMNDIVFITKSLKKWMADESAPDTALMNLPFSPRIRKDPMGTILVIGAYNFPFQLSLGPAIGAIAAGCSVVLKPSENAPNCAVVLQRIFAASLDPETYTVVQGAIPETTSLLEQKWDQIFYTGNHVVGTIIAKKAAETLTPVILELGGKNPAIVTKNADPRLAARRLLWAKCLNAGQVCVSQNYVTVEREIFPMFISELKNAMADFFPNGVQASTDYGRIVNQRQFLRLKKMLDESRGKILIGGTMSEKDLFIEPTVVQVTDLEDSLIKDESFGPFIPILIVNSLDEAITIANSVHDTPLGVYAFGSKSETNKVLAQTRSGGASINDGFFHASIPTMPFGGVGSSGSGAYRGRASFDAFTHRRSVTTTPGWIESLLDIRYPPYSLAKQKKFSSMNALKPNFDREGRESFNWFRWVFGLGSGGLKGAVVRWVLVIAVAVGVKKYAPET